MRNVLLKTVELEYSNLLIISEEKGNPNTLTFYNNKGEPLITLEVSVALKNIRTNINHKKLSVICQIEELKDLIPILDLPEETNGSDSNLLMIKKHDDKKAIIEFIDDKGHQTNPIIYIHDWSIG